MAVVEYARNVCDVSDAVSREFSQDGQAFVDYVPGQSDDIEK